MNKVPEAYAVLDKDVGTWDAELVIQRPGAEPSRVRGVSTSRKIGDGRWLVTDFKTEGGDFEGHAVTGYDPARERYVHTWVDGLRPFLAVGEGTWDAAARTMSIVTEASYGGHTMRWRETTETVDADTRVFRSFMVGPDGVERETMVGTYRRRA